MARRFTEEEAQRIFARVAERQREASPSEGGLSLTELEEAARAAGLDAALVAAAAAELDAASHPERTLAGAPVEVVRQRVLSGPLTDDLWAEMVGAARREFGQPGIAGQIGRLREWTCLSGTGKNETVTRLTAEPTAEGTRITLSRSIRDVALGFTFASMIQGTLALLFGVLAVAGVEPDLWIPAAILVGLSLLFGAGTQVGTRVWHRQEAKRFEHLLDRLELTAHRAGPELAPSLNGEGPVEPRVSLDLDALDPLADEDRQPAAGRRTR